MDRAEAPPPEERQTSVYDRIGGEASVREIVNRFYDLMERDPAYAALRAMHAEDLGPMRERLFEFLSGWFGGPPLYFQRPGHACIMSAHRPFAIGARERDDWLACMRCALSEAQAPEDLQPLLNGAFVRMAEAFRNR